MIVHGKNVLLKMYKGGVENAIACNASCSLEFTTDTYETTFYDSDKNRTWIPNKTSATITGSGPIFLGEPITVADVVGWQTNRQLIEFNFSLTDGTDVMRVHGFGYFTRVNITGDVSQFATCDYTMIVNGEAVFYSTNSDPNADDDHPWEYEAEGGETEVADPDLVGATMVYLAREGVGIRVITSGVPGGSEVLFESTLGKLTFGTPLFKQEGDPGEWVHAIYQK